MDNLPPTSRTISKWDMRRLYNEGGYYKRALGGEFRVETDEFQPNVVSKRVPKGSTSIETFYYDLTGILIARLHHYVKPDGRIGGSGKPDPKFLRIGGIEYHLPKRGDSEPARMTNNEVNRILDKTGLLASVTYLYFIDGRVRKLWHSTVRAVAVRLGIAEKR
jgi:hypothetical protein